MPLNSEQQQTAEAIRRRMFESINEQRDPIAALGAEDHEFLTRVHIDEPVIANAMLAQIRDHARAMGWPDRRINSISFAAYVDAARAFVRLRDNARRASNVARIEDARAARAGRRGRRQAEPVPDPTPDAFIQSPSPRLAGIGLLQRHRPGRIWFDTFHQRMFTDWDGTDDAGALDARLVDDDMINNAVTWLQTQDAARFAALTIRTAREWIAYVARRTIKNEPVDWLYSLPAWDGTERLRAFMPAAFGCEDSEFNREAGRCWFVSMIARVISPGSKVDTMPVFIGGQGRRKSQALEIIGGKWYRTASSGIDSKDFLQEIQGAWIFEIQELHSLIATKHGAAKVKAVLSTREDYFRLPYATLPQTFKRTAVCSGTTNEQGDWHNDDTGGRRFWPFHVRDVNLEWINEHREQLFAEALAYYNLGADDPNGQWWNVPEAAQRELIEAERHPDAWREAIAMRLATTANLYRNPERDTLAPPPGDGDWGNAITNLRITAQWLNLPSEAAGNRRNTIRVARIMRELGWTSIQVRYTDRVRAWVWVSRDDAPVVEQEQNEEIPF